MLLIPEEPHSPEKLPGLKLPNGESLEKFSSRKSDDLSTTSTEVLPDGLRISHDMVVDEKIQVNNTAKIVGQPILENVLESRLPVDTVISCSDGKLGAHRLVLAAISPFLGILFEDQKLGEVAVILLPEIKKNTMEILLHLAYTGFMIFPPDKEEEVYAAMECLMFGQVGKLELSMVKVKSDPPMEAQPGTSSASGYAGSTSGSNRTSGAEQTASTPSRDIDTRKRRLSNSAERRRKTLIKKPKYDRNGKRIPVAIRSGTPIGKEGLMKIRRREEKKILQEGTFVCKAPFLTSDQHTSTVRLNAKRLPLTSIRLRQLSLAEKVCIELHRQSDWSSTNVRDDYTISRESPSEYNKPTVESGRDNVISLNTSDGSLGASSSSRENSTQDIESGFTEEIQDFEQEMKAKMSEAKDNDSCADSVACSDLDRMDLSHRPKKPRTRRRTGESVESSRSKSVIDIDPYEVLEVI